MNLRSDTKRNARGFSLMRVSGAGASGYTLVELVVVIIILGVVAAIVGPKFFGTQVFNARGYADELASAMRYSQKVAVASGCSVRLSITTAGYSAMQQVASGNRCNSASSTWTTTVTRSDGAPLAGTPPNNANASGTFTYIFDSRGSALISPGTLTVGSYTLVVDASSGTVTVQ